MIELKNLENEEISEDLQSKSCSSSAVAVNAEL